MCLEMGYTPKMASFVSFTKENDGGPDFSLHKYPARFEGWTTLIELSVVAGTAQFRCQGRGWARSAKLR